jgi:hypothetical protein
VACGGIRVRRARVARFYRWLAEHPSFGPLVREWREHRTFGVLLAAWLYRVPSRDRG